MTHDKAKILKLEAEGYEAKGFGPAKRPDNDNNVGLNSENTEEQNYQNSLMQPLLAKCNYLNGIDANIPKINAANQGKPTENNQEPQPAPTHAPTPGPRPGPGLTPKPF